MYKTFRIKFLETNEKSFLNFDPIVLYPIYSLFNFHEICIRWELEKTSLLNNDYNAIKQFQKEIYFQ